MNTALITSLSFFGFSLFLLLITFFLFSKKNPVLRKYICISTVLYNTGTLLVLIITIFKRSVPLEFVWLCEAFVFAIYACSSGMILYIVKKFADGAKPSANQNPDETLEDPDKEIRH